MKLKFKLFQFMIIFLIGFTYFDKSPPNQTNIIENGRFFGWETDGYGPCNFHIFNGGVVESSRKVYQSFYVFGIKVGEREKTEPYSNYSEESQIVDYAP